MPLDLGAKLHALSERKDEDLRQTLPTLDPQGSLDFFLEEVIEGMDALLSISFDNDERVPWPAPTGEPISIARLSRRAP